MKGDEDIQMSADEEEDLFAPSADEEDELPSGRKTHS